MFGFGNRNNNNYNNDYCEEYSNNNLQVKYNNLLSKYENSVKCQEYAEKEYKKLKSMTDNLCKSILSNEYNYNQLGGNSILKDMDIYKLIEFSTMDIQKQKIDNMNLIQKLNEQIKVQQQIINTLKEQLTQSMVLNNNSITEEDVNNSNIINNTNNTEMDVFNTNGFDMESTIGKIEVDNINNKPTKIKVDAFGNIINEDEEKKDYPLRNNKNHKNNENVVQNRNNIDRQEKPMNNMKNNQNTNMKKVTSRVEDENSKLGDILGMGNNKPQDINNHNQRSKQQYNSKPHNNKKPNEVVATPIMNNPKPKIQTPIQNNNSPNNSNAPTLTLENVDAYMAAMTQIMWDILSAIGTTGYSTSNDIINVINADGEKYTKSLVLNSIASLTKMNVLTSENISTGYRRFKIFKLSVKGETMYKSHFNSEPVESEIDKIIRDHDNVLHGYSIRDARELMLSVHKCKKAGQYHQ